MKKENMKNEALEETEKTKSGKGWKRWIYRILSAAILIYGLYVVVGYFFTYSDGFRAGKLIKFSKKGYIYKTWEGQIYLGTLTPDEAGIASKYWDFSVDRGDERVIKALEDAMVHKHEVRLHYKEKVVQFGWRGDTHYFVDSVDMVN